MCRGSTPPGVAVVEFSFTLENGDSGSGSQLLVGMRTITGQDVAAALQASIRHLEQLDASRRQARAHARLAQAVKHAQGANGRGPYVSYE